MSVETEELLKKAEMIARHQRRRGYVDTASLIESLASALRSSRSGEGWRPIETAPMDGTWFLACATKQGWQATRLVQYRYPDDRLPTAGEGNLWPSEPTHWMPLPASPKALKTGGE